MKKLINIMFVAALFGAAAVACCPKADKGGWEDYNVGKILFTDKSPEAEGSAIYHTIIPNPEEYIANAAREVLSILYESPQDSITQVDTIDYWIEDREGISAKGGFEGPNARPKGGHYMKGYRTTGYFLVWIRDNKDPDFLWKFNRSTLEVIPWSFDGAIKHILGEEYEIEALWHEYQVAVGDIEE